MTYRYIFSVGMFVKPIAALIVAIAILISVEPFYLGLAIVFGAFFLRFMYLRIVRAIYMYRRLLVCIEFCEKHESDANHSIENCTTGIGMLEGFLCEMRVSISHKGSTMVFVGAVVECEAFVPWNSVQRIKEAELMVYGERCDVAELYMRTTSQEILIPWNTEFRDMLPETIGLDSD